jgi:hypothetical protein
MIASFLVPLPLQEQHALYTMHTNDVLHTWNWHEINTSKVAESTHQEHSQKYHTQCGKVPSHLKGVRCVDNINHTPKTKWNSHCYGAWYHQKAYCTYNTACNLTRMDETYHIQASKTLLTTSILFCTNMNGVSSVHNKFSNIKFQEMKIKYLYWLWFHVLTFVSKITMTANSTPS